MNWDELFQTQLRLDQYIEENHHLQKEDLFDKKVLALLVELGELANETRCFKFWSQKPASSEEVILEEYVDGLHFILSLGLDKGIRYEERTLSTSANVTEAFNQVFQDVDRFKKNFDKESYQQLFADYLSLGAALGFTEKEIQSAYHKKNQQNHQRQDEGY